MENEEWAFFMIGWFIISLLAFIGAWFPPYDEGMFAFGLFGTLAGFIYVPIAVCILIDSNNR